VARPNEVGTDPFLTAGWVRHRGRDYTAGQVALDDPRVSPAFADLEGLPPLYLPVGEYDTLREGVAALAEAARRAGVAVTHERWPGVGHGWHGLVGMGVPEAIEAWRATSKFIDAALSPS
jgi:acetyl esterase/lipase